MTRPIRTLPYLAAFLAGYVVGALVEFLWLDHLFGGTGLRVEPRERAFEWPDDIGAAWERAQARQSASRRDGDLIDALTAAGVLAVIGTIPVLIGFEQNHDTFLSNDLFRFGVVVLVLATLSLWWAITLQLAHGHAAGHIERARRARPARDTGSVEPGKNRPASAVSPVAPAPTPLAAPVPASAVREWGIHGEVVPAERVFTSITPAELVGFYVGRTNIDGDRLAKPHLQKWLPVQGKVQNVLGSDEDPERDFVMVTLEGPPDVTLFFRGKWLQRAAILRPGDPVKAIGRLDRAEPYGVYLEDCELVDS